MLKIAKERLNDLYAKINESMGLFIPIKKAGEVNYHVWGEGKEVSLETLKTVKSPKNMFFPQSENMMKFKTEGKNIEIIDVRDEKRPFVLFGVKPCDYKAIEVLDKVFLADPVDSYYQSRREATTIVTLACSKPEESCFCKVFGIDATAAYGDVTTWLDDENLYWQANTEKGEALTALLKGLLEEGGEAEVAAQQEATKAIIDNLPFSNLDLSRFKPENLNELFDDPAWAEMSEACLGCGTCTFVCPTCQCFDIRDFKTSEGVIRYRCWDSCMYSDFTLMAHGNSRTTQMQRFRQRFMHKLVYYPSQNDGLYSCVGCGRCVNKCPQRLNIVKVIKTLGGKNND
ncbi:MAG: 4Fe-4S dicluster domain-containing protein [Clostridia bacterium]|nr:4Fe-4S dicluster domain-containing protein [Clostridia bacterium]MBQ8430089.1 4Fe-4S dicluster domain-containing protein [Clostridia bacterium]MBQ8430243.1 4Fe-4S dicluster domain-containing protein [Clostridia bacterium]